MSSLRQLDNDSETVLRSKLQSEPLRPQDRTPASTGHALVEEVGAQVSTGTRAAERLTLVSELIRDAASGVERLRGEVGPTTNLGEAAYALHRALIALAEIGGQTAHQRPAQSSAVQPGSGPVLKLSR